MLIVYIGFNTFINFPVFSVLMDPFYKIPFLFHTSGLEYPSRGGIQHLLVLTRKPGIKVCKYNFLGELMVWAFEHQGLQYPPSLSDALSHRETKSCRCSLSGIWYPGRLTQAKATFQDKDGPIGL